jgi:hypothetical protein
MIRQIPDNIKIKNRKGQISSGLREIKTGELGSKNIR